MKIKDIPKAKDPDLRASAIAMPRAAKLARKTAILTNTSIVVLSGGKLTCIPARGPSGNYQARRSRKGMTAQNQHTWADPVGHCGPTSWRNDQVRSETFGVGHHPIGLEDPFAYRVDV